MMFWEIYQANHENWLIWPIKQANKKPLCQRQRGLVNATAQSTPRQCLSAGIGAGC